MISPVIHFSGNCLEAIRLYEKAFNVSNKQVTLYKDAPDNHGMDITNDMFDLVMHSTITLCGTKFNMSDVMENKTAGNMVCFNVFLDSEDELQNAFEVLSNDGKVIQKVGPQFFSKLYTVIIDRFGIRWQIVLV
ncbi:VOC family protein [Paenibacillus tengchongensis]|uniref:VOC family protein n=1 Tax=Paenibacillus tengchongensis TaxID=2608684 RepID=UPI001652B20C|nr:VOC family protein [Paenibacillus tengchongensis]